MTASGACRSTTSTSPKSQVPTLIYATYVKDTPRLPPSPSLCPFFVSCITKIPLTFNPEQTGGRPAGSCTAALFLKAFVPEELVRWAHIDIAGTMEASRATPYQEKGMTGRPVRALVEFVKRYGSAPE
jgi:hypothetical protein